MVRTALVSMSLRQEHQHWHLLADIFPSVENFSICTKTIFVFGQGKARQGKATCPVNPMSPDLDFVSQSGCGEPKPRAAALAAKGCS